MEKKLGKIKSVQFGVEEGRLGIHFSLEGKEWCVVTSNSTLDFETINHDESCDWNEEQRSKRHDEIMKFVSKLLNQARVSNVSELKGTPIEVTMNNGLLMEWRVLTEVI